VDEKSNIVFVTYKPNAHFDTAVLRAAAEKIDGVFLVIQVSARGRVVEEGKKHFFVAGPDRFLLIEPIGSAPPLPPVSEKILSVIGNVDDSGEMVQLKILQAKPASE
jgi:hypothetical protein